MPNFISLDGLKTTWSRFQRSIETEAAEEFLELLLNAMRFMFTVSHRYRENIKDFQGRYQFKSKDGGLTMAATFNKGRMTVKEKVIDNPDVTIIFRDGKTLFNFLFSPRQDILGAMLRQDIQTEGNLNYIYRFGFLAKRLQLMMTPG
ncbi:MAG: hypothetical protein QNJ22_24090 [Desulfosarcinaceae bacterium]|nr:hypothetical protein [Desulfosarcinaceae bacterium]